MSGHKETLLHIGSFIDIISILDLTPSHVLNNKFERYDLALFKPCLLGYFVVQENNVNDATNAFFKM